MGIEQVNGVQFGLANAPEVQEGSKPIVPASAFENNDTFSKQPGMSNGEAAAATVGTGLALGTAIGVGYFSHKQGSVKKGAKEFGNWVKNIFKRKASGKAPDPASNPAPKSKGGGGGGNKPVTGAPVSPATILEQKKDVHKILNDQTHIKNSVGDTVFRDLHQEVSAIQTSGDAAKFLETHSDKFLNTSYAAQKAATEGQVSALTTRLHDAATPVADLPGIRTQLQSQQAMLKQFEEHERATVRKLEEAFGLERTEFKPGEAFDFAAHKDNPNVRYVFTDADKHGMPLAKSSVYKDANGNIVHGDVPVGIHMPEMSKSITQRFPVGDKTGLAARLDNDLGIKLGQKELHDDALIGALYKKRAALTTGADQAKFDGILKSYGFELNPTTLAAGRKFRPTAHPDVQVRSIHITDDPKLHGQIAEIVPGYTFKGSTRTESVRLHVHPETAKLNFEAHKALQDQIGKIRSDAALNDAMDTEMRRFLGEPGQAELADGMFWQLLHTTNADDARQIIDTVLKDKDAAAFLKRLKSATVPGEKSATIEQIRAQIQAIDASGDLTRRLDRILN